MKDEDFSDGICQLLEAINYKLGGGYDASTGIGYRNDVFETFGFWSHEADDNWDGVGFRHFESGLEVSWYKRVGRSTESNKGMKTLDWYKALVECLESVRDDDGSTHHE